MGDFEDTLESVPGEHFVERLIGDVDVERLNGAIERELAMYRKEKLADPDDIESVYEREYVAVKEGQTEGTIEEIFLGNDKGDTITIKERR